MLDIQVDISVPSQWPDDVKCHMSPEEYFGEMAPIFCTTEVSMEDIGTHMQKHIRENHLSAKPRRLLVGGLKAEKILLASPVIRWCLQHHMNITRIYQVCVLNTVIYYLV
jgi:hypothetical protein